MSDMVTDHDASARRRRAADRVPDRVPDRLIFLTDTGKRLCCSVGSVGRNREQRWLIVDPEGALYIGPLASAAPASGSPQHVIAEWWQEQSAPAIPPRAD